MEVGTQEGDAEGGRRKRSHIPARTLFRSVPNVMVLGSKKPRQVLTFLYGPYRDMAPLPAVSLLVFVGSEAG